MNIIFKLFLVLILFSPIINADKLTSQDVIKKMIVAYGGEKNVEKLNAYEQHWHIETKTNDKNGTDTRKVDMPYLLHTKLVYPDKTESRVLIKDYGTKEFSGKKVQAKGPILDAMKVQLMRLYNPLVLQNNLKNITLDIEDRYYVLTFKNGSVTSKYFVSKSNFLVDRVIGQLKMGSYKMEFLTLYKNYKSISGVMVHHKEIKFAGDVNTAIMRLENMRFTEKIKRHR